MILVILILKNIIFIKIFKKLIVVDAKGHLLVQNIMVVQIDKYRKYKSHVIIHSS